MDEKDHKRNEPGDLWPFSCSTGLCIKLESKAQKCASLHGNRTTWGRADMWLLRSRQSTRKYVLSEVRGALTSATGTPSGGRQCSTIMLFRGTSVPWGSCSKFFLRSEGEKKKQKQTWDALLHAYINAQDLRSSQGLKVTYRRFGRSPCGSWRFPGGSRQRTDTSNPPGHENLPPADVTRWSSLHGFSALWMRVLISPIRDGDLHRGRTKFTSSFEIKCRWTHCPEEDQRMPAKAAALDTTIQVKAINIRNCAIFHS